MRAAWITPLQIGNAYPGTDNRIHMPDEFVNLDEFVRNAKMIAAAKSNWPASKRLNAPTCDKRSVQQ